MGNADHGPAVIAADGDESMHQTIVRLAVLASANAIALPTAAVEIELVTRTHIAAPLTTNGDSFGTGGVSDDGRYTLMVSEASNLVPGDTNHVADLFLYDHQLGSVERVSLGNDGTQANGNTHARADLSDDARYVVFESSATNLVAGDTHGTPQIYLRDRMAQTTTLVSHDTLGHGAATGAHSPQISADGRYVVFESEQMLISSDPDTNRDIYRFDRDSGTLDLVSVSATGASGNRESYDARISADGRYVAFHTDATNLFPGDTNDHRDIVLRDTVGNINVNASITPDGGQFRSLPELASGNALSADGRYVLFATAEALEPVDGNNSMDGFRFDRVTSDSVRVTHDRNGGVLLYGASASAISADGSVVLMGSRDTGLAGGSAHGALRHYARNLATGAITMVKQRPGRLNPYHETQACDLSGSGAVAYCSSADEYLTDADSNALSDVFRSATGADGGSRVSLSLPAPVASANDDSDSLFGGVSHDGRFVVFSSEASNLVAGDNNGKWDIFLRDRLTDTTQRVSRQFSGGESDCNSTAARITPDARFVVFESCPALIHPSFWGSISTQIYRYDRLADQLQHVSIGNNGVLCAPSCSEPSISDDGNVIAFRTDDTDFGGTPAIWGGVAVRRLTDGTSTLANVPPGGGRANGWAEGWQVSGDGRFVLFSDTSSNLVAGDNNGVADVFAYAMDTGVLRRASVGPSGEELPAASRFQDVSYDGSRFLFENRDLACPSPGALHLHDSASGQSACVRDGPDDLVYAYTHRKPATLSSDGNRVAFPTPVPSPQGGAPVETLMFYDHTTKRVHRITPPEMNRDAQVLGFCGDGNCLLFSSTAGNLVPDDGNNQIRDVFIALNLIDALFTGGFESP